MARKKNPTRRRLKKHARALKALARSLQRLEERLGALEEQNGRIHASALQAAEDAAAARAGMRAMRDASLMDPPAPAHRDHHTRAAAPVAPVAQADAIADRPMDDGTPADPAPDRWPAFDEGRLRAMEARLAARTPGAWCFIRTDDGPVVARDGAWSHRIAATPDAADAHLIAHAPGDLEWLIRELRHSWGREAAWRDTAVMWRAWHARELPALRAQGTTPPHTPHVTRPGAHMALLAAVLAVLAWWLT